jgi:hypothetical protein
VSALLGGGSIRAILTAEIRAFTRSAEETMATKSKSTIQGIVDTIRELVKQPLSDESNEVPTAKAVRRSKTVAGGVRRSKAKKTKKAAKKRAASSRKATSGKRNKKR